MERNELCPLEGPIVTVGELAGASECGGGWWELGRGLLGCGVISRSCSATHLRVRLADLGCTGSLSKYLHANWCYLIHLSVMRFHKFKNWRRRAPPVALSWQFDSDFIIRAWFYNKQELSCLIRHARRRSPGPHRHRPKAPPDSPHAHCPHPFLVRREGKAPNIHHPLSPTVPLPAWLEQEGSCLIDLTRYLPLDHCHLKKKKI